MLCANGAKFHRIIPVHTSASCGGAASPIQNSAAMRRSFGNSPDRMPKNLVFPSGFCKTSIKVGCPRFLRHQKRTYIKQTQLTFNISLENWDVQAELPLRNLPSI